MSPMTIPLLAVFLLLGAATTTTEVEPEPEPASTTADASPTSTPQATTSVGVDATSTSTMPTSTPTPTQQDTTSAGADTTSSVVRNIVKVVIVDVDLPALNYANEASLELAFRDGIRNAAGVSIADVQVILQTITVKFSYSGLPALTGDFTESALAQVLATAVNVSTQSLEVTIGDAFSSSRRLDISTGSRRLQTSASIAVTITNEPNEDVVMEASKVIAAAGDTALLKEKLTNAIGFGVPPPVLLSTPSVVIGATSNVLTASGSPLTQSGIMGQLQSSVGGTVIVRSISDGTTTIMAATTSMQKVTSTLPPISATSFALPTSRAISTFVIFIAAVVSRI